MSNNGTLNPTSATQWREMREKGVLVTLPSGNVARLRPVGIFELVKRGRIPDSLTGVAADTVAQGRPSTEQVKNTLGATVELLHVVCEAAFLDPKVIIPEGDTEPDEDALGENTITVFHLSMEDMLFVLDFTSAPTRALEPFRQEKGSDVASVPDGESSKRETK